MSPRVVQGDGFSVPFLGVVGNTHKNDDNNSNNNTSENNINNANNYNDNNNDKVMP